MTIYDPPHLTNCVPQTTRQEVFTPRSSSNRIITSAVEQPQTRAQQNRVSNRILLASLVKTAFDEFVEIADRMSLQRFQPRTRGGHGPLSVLMGISASHASDGLDGADLVVATTCRSPVDVLERGNRARRSCWTCS